jgi:hypothetical protein
LEPAVKAARGDERFRGKYGAGDVRKYYTNFDVAVLVPLN